MELQVAEIASSEACRGAECADALRALLFMNKETLVFVLDAANAELRAG